MISEYLQRKPTMPDISKLRIVGSKAFVYVNPKNRREGDNKAVEGVLVGFGEDLKTYRVMVKGTTTIIESDSVDIHEKIPGHDDIISEIRPQSDAIVSEESVPSVPQAPRQQPAAAPQRQPVVTLTHSILYYLSVYG